MLGHLVLTAFHLLAVFANIVGRNEPVSPSRRKFALPFPGRDMPCHCQSADRAFVLSGPATLIAATTLPCALRIGTAIQRILRLRSPLSMPYPRWRIASSSARNASGSVMVLGVRCGSSWVCNQRRTSASGLMCDQRLAQAGAVHFDGHARRMEHDAHRLARVAAIQVKHRPIVGECRQINGFVGFVAQGFEIGRGEAAHIEVFLDGLPKADHLQPQPVAVIAFQSR